MFTGIIQNFAAVIATEAQENSRRIILHLIGLDTDLELGASVAVDGVCLTVVELENHHASFDVIEETLRCTTLGSLHLGSQVNIERACRVGSEMGGHSVTGHVDTTGLIGLYRQNKTHTELTLNYTGEWNPYVLPKGWITIDGISLTVVTVQPETLTVHLIPETQKRTTLVRKKKEIR